MNIRPKCNFCEKKSDIYEENNNKVFYCASCFITKKYGNNFRPRDQRVSRQR